MRASFIGESANEMNFFRTLRADMAKIADFFVKTQQRYGDLLGHLETHFKAFEVRRSIEFGYEASGACSKRAMRTKGQRRRSWARALRSSRRCSCSRTLR